MTELMPPNTLHLHEREIAYFVKRVPHSQTVQLKLSHDLKLEVSMPSDSNVDVKALLRKKKGWIERKLAELSASKRIFDGQRILYKGDYHRLAFVESPRQSVRIEDGKVVLPTYASINLSQVLKDWMKRETENLVEKRLSHFRGRLKLRVGDFSVRDVKKWGHCTKDGNLVFSELLVALPSEVSDYVILHELAHLREFNHSRGFKQLLASVCPDFKEKETALKRFIVS